MIKIAMNIIGKITEDNFERKTTPEKWSSYRTRPAARAILLNELSEIALMHVSKHHYFKLPGGGIDDGESVQDALIRELAEELGAQAIDIIAEIGQVDEYRDQWEMKSTHYGFIAKVIGELDSPDRTEKEIEHGYETVWATNIDEAIRLVRSGKPTKYGHDFEKERELIFLENAKSSKLVH
jgi:8-oxo-dGTP pyrophosphatase MutT (NUDIX family)